MTGDELRERAHVVTVPYPSRRGVVHLARCMRCPWSHGYDTTSHHRAVAAATDHVEEQLLDLVIGG